MKKIVKCVLPVFVLALSLGGCTKVWEEQWSERIPPPQTEVNPEAPDWDDGGTTIPSANPIFNDDNKSKRHENMD